MSFWCHRLDQKEGLVECATVCVKSVVILGHFLADQLTLSQPGGTHYPHAVLPAPHPGFLTLAACLYLDRIQIRCQI